MESISGVDLIHLDMVFTMEIKNFHCQQDLYNENRFDK